MQLIKTDIGGGALPVSKATPQNNLLARPAFEIYRQFYPPMDAFLWELTPKMCDLVGRALLPTYCDFRIDREGTLAASIPIGSLANTGFRSPSTRATRRSGLSRWDLRRSMLPAQG
jgi:hypothetical protein